MTAVTQAISERRSARAYLIRPVSAGLVRDIADDLAENGQALALNFQKGAAAFAWRGQRMTFTRLQLSDPGRYTLT